MYWLSVKEALRRPSQGCDRRKQHPPGRYLAAVQAGPQALQPTPAPVHMTHGPSSATWSRLPNVKMSSGWQRPIVESMTICSRVAAGTQTDSSRFEKYRTRTEAEGMTALRDTPRSWKGPSCLEAATTGSSTHGAERAPKPQRAGRGDDPKTGRGEGGRQFS